MPGSTYWDRGLEFMRQVEHPLSAELKDAGIVWRLAPALLARGLGLHGYASFFVPWLGLAVLLTLSTGLILRRTGDRYLAFLTAALLGTTSVTLTVTGWLGLNDAWYASALLIIAFLPNRNILIVSILVGPWIDERFILALPLAAWVRSVTLGRSWQSNITLCTAVVSVLLYVIVRTGNFLQLSTTATSTYYQSILSGACLEWLPWTSLGIFMGLRAAWILPAVAVGGNCRRTDLQPSIVWPVLLAAGPIIVITLLAADTDRSTTMLIPLVLLGVERMHVLHGMTHTRRLISWLLFANLLMPAMHVTYHSGDIINALPIELARLFSHK